jgi:hypothetical protein
MIKSLEKTRGVELFGPLALVSRRWREQIAYVWHHGWIEEIMFRDVPSDLPAPPDIELMQHALHAPMARFARWLAVDTWYSTPIYEALAECTCLRRLRGLRLGTVTACFAEILDALPALEELELVSTVTTTGGHPRVRRLRFTIDEEVPLIRGAWPALERLEIEATEHLARMHGFHPMFDTLPTIRHLSIAAPYVPDDLVQAIATTIGPRLETLDIRAEMSTSARDLVTSLRA